jgi:hypothetical protein
LQPFSLSHLVLQSFPRASLQLLGSLSCLTIGNEPITIVHLTRMFRSYLLIGSKRVAQLEKGMKRVCCYHSATIVTSYSQHQYTHTHTHTHPTWEVKIGRIMILGQPGQGIHKISSCLTAVYSNVYL